MLTFRNYYRIPTVTIQHPCNTNLIHNIVQADRLLKRRGVYNNVITGAFTIEVKTHSF